MLGFIEAKAIALDSNIASLLAKRGRLKIIALNIKTTTTVNMPVVWKRFKDLLKLPIKGFKIDNEASYHADQSVPSLQKIYGLNKNGADDTKNLINNPAKSICVQAAETIKINFGNLVNNLIGKRPKESFLTICGSVTVKLMSTANSIYCG